MMLALVACTYGLAQYELQSALTETVPCGTKDMEDRLRIIFRNALDEALKEHIKNTFEVWMKDDRDQPARAARGVRGGTNAYLQALATLETWHLMACPRPRP